MKNTKSSPASILIGKHILVKRTGWNLKFKVSSVGDNMVEGLVETSNPECPFKVGDTYSVSINEVKYHVVIS